MGDGLGHRRRPHEKIGVDGAFGGFALLVALERVGGGLAGTEALRGCLN